MVLKRRAREVTARRWRRLPDERADVRLLLSPERRHWSLPIRPRPLVPRRAAERRTLLLLRLRRRRALVRGQGLWCGVLRRVLVRRQPCVLAFG